MRPESLLRERARVRLEEVGVPDPGSMAEEEVREVLRELRLHELELEMQNQELRETQRELEESRDRLAGMGERYRSLYEFAPVGYLNLDVLGTIESANLRAGRMLRVPRAKRIGRKLSDYVDPADQDRWYFERRAVANGEGAGVLELSLERADGSRLAAELALFAEPAILCAAPQVIEIGDGTD